MNQNLLRTLICLAVMITLLGLALAASDSITGKLLAASAILIGSVASYLSKEGGKHTSGNYRQ
jgi:predicted membrane protein